MDPTFRQHVLAMLATVDASHPEPADGASWNACPGCKADMPEGRAQHLLDEIAALVAGPDLKPHVVHVNEPFEELKPVVRIDPDDAEGRRALKDARGKPVMVTGRRYVGPADCPDCRGGLSSRGHDLVCQRVSRETSLRGCHDHCIVACGMEEASDG
jgi:hypothetical protein